jgi:hypothetical protein
MPSLLKGLQETQWRSKQASILLLGSMAYCAPAQLASCLPQIVPKLCECFSDTHPKVQAAAKDSLSVCSAWFSVGGWILQHVTGTQRWLLCPGHRQCDSESRNFCYRTVFVGRPCESHGQHKDCTGHVVHYGVCAFHRRSIAGPYRARVEVCFRFGCSCCCREGPMAGVFWYSDRRRGLHDRSTGVKMSACTIIGNMCSLVGDPQVLASFPDHCFACLPCTLTVLRTIIWFAQSIVPYLSTFMGPLRKAVVDPNPDVRRVAGTTFRLSCSGCRIVVIVGVSEQLVRWAR